MIIKIKSTYRGMVAIGEKYILEALKKKDFLVIKYQDKEMIIKADKIETSIKRHNPKERYVDRRTGQYYTLFYFKGQPILNNQLNLFHG